MTFILILITALVILAILLAKVIFPFLEGLRGPKKYIYKQQVKNTKSNTPIDEDFEILKVKGSQFEEFIAKKIKQNKYFKILDWRSDKYVEGIYAESNKNPDLEIQFSLNNIVSKFAIECKYHSKIHNDIIIAPQYKIDNYKKYAIDKKINVFIALGLAGDACQPSELYIIPLKNINSERISYSNLQKFRKYKTDSSFFFDEKSLQLK
jgi:hypothetical protein